jgi:hypothetical protein
MTGMNSWTKCTYIYCIVGLYNTIGLLVVTRTLDHFTSYFGQQLGLHLLSLCRFLLDPFLLIYFMFLEKLGFHKLTRGRGVIVRFHLVYLDWLSSFGVPGHQAGEDSKFWGSWGAMVLHINLFSQMVSWFQYFKVKMVKVKVKDYFAEGEGCTPFHLGMVANKTRPLALKCVR